MWDTPPPDPLPLTYNRTFLEWQDPATVEGISYEGMGKGRQKWVTNPLSHMTDAGQTPHMHS